MRVAALAVLLALFGTSFASAEPAVVAKVRTGIKPCVPLAATGSVWVANFGSSNIVRVSPRTNKVTGRVRASARPCGLAFGARSLWVDGFGTSTIERVNPRTLKVTRRIRVGLQPYDVAFAFGSVWSSDYGANRLSRIDPRRNRVVRRISVPSPTGFAVAGGSLWVGSGSGTAIYRIDAKTNRARAVDIGAAGPHWLAGGPDDIWIASVFEGRVVRVDAASGAIVASVAVGARPGDGSVLSDGSVWFPIRGENVIARIDPEANEVTERVGVGPGPFVVNEAFGDLWVGSFDGNDVWRIRP